MPLVKKTPLADATEPQRSLEEVLVAIAAEDQDVRREAVAYLVRERQGLTELANRLSIEPCSDIRHSIGNLLIEAGNAETTRIAAQLLASDSATLRNEVREILPDLPGGPEHAQVLLGHSDPDIRVFALEVLATRAGQAEGERYAIQALADQDVNVVCAAIELLGDVGGKDALSALRELAEKVSNTEYLSFCVGVAVKSITTRLKLANEAGFHGGS